MGLRFPSDESSSSFRVEKGVKLLLLPPAPQAAVWILYPTTLRTRAGGFAVMPLVPIVAGESFFSLVLFWRNHNKFLKQRRFQLIVVAEVTFVPSGVRQRNIYFPDYAGIFNY